MRKVFVSVLVLAAVVVAGSLLALGVYAAGIAPETGGAVAVLVAVWMAFNGKNKGKQLLKDRMYAPPLAIIAVILGLCSYFALFEVIRNRAG